MGLKVKDPNGVWLETGVVLKVLGGGDAVEKYDSTIIVESIYDIPGVIPENATYLVASTCEILERGDKFPETVCDDDTYIYGDYMYSYGNDINGWKVSVRDKNKETYGVMLDSINGINITSLNSTFKNCIMLTAAPELPNSITDMSHAFENCSNLITVANIPDNTIDMSYTFDYCTSLTAVPHIPNSVTNMTCAFYSCRSLTTVQNIPDGVTSLSNTFGSCSSLASVPTIPDSVVDMTSTFDGCSSLTAVPNISNNVTSLFSTFNGCTTLTASPIIHSSVTKMSRTFYNCTSLASITFAGTVAQWEAIDISSWNNKVLTDVAICSDGEACIRHTGGTATCEHLAVCSRCGKEYGSFAQHTPVNGTCSVCGIDVTVIESTHYPYEDNLNYVVLGTWDHSDAKSVDITIDYQTQSTSYDWCSITSGTDYTAGSSYSATRNYLTTSGSVLSTTGTNYSVKFGNSSRTTKTFTNVNMLTGSVIFKSNSSSNNYYGVKVTITPNY